VVVAVVAKIHLKVVVAVVPVGIEILLLQNRLEEEVLLKL